MCDLHIADFLDPQFVAEGLGVRTSSSFEGSGESIGYEALSYAWGTSVKEEVIICNGIDFQVTRNLLEALQALRWIWVDAEKAVQVSKMFLIYKKAAKVVVWLGAANEGIEEVVVANSSGDDPSNLFDIDRIFAGLESLYTRPWFSRLWVQQEIFASRKLTFFCGTFSFTWDGIFLDPKAWLLARSQDRQELSRTFDDENSGVKLSKQRLKAIESLDILRKTQLTSFERCSSLPNDSNPHIIEALLETTLIGAADPRDYVYSLLGIVDFPSKNMSILEWAVARHNEILIPIDYATDLNSLLSALTWNLFLQHGFYVLMI